MEERVRLTARVPDRPRGRTRGDHAESDGEHVDGAMTAGAPTPATV
jgi:hypothetical protein